MPAKVTPGLDELRAQARRTFRQLPIYLMLRLREVEQHLTPAQLDELGPVLNFLSYPAAAVLPARVPADGRLALLVEYGLFTGEEPVPEVALPSLTLPAADGYLFRSGPALVGSEVSLEWISLDFVARQTATVLRVELLRTAVVHAEVLAAATEIFTRMTADLSAEAVFETARYWAALHGARDLAWQPVPVDVRADFLPDTRLSCSSEPDVLPRLRRGRGIFRNPN